MYNCTYLSHFPNNQYIHVSLSQREHEFSVRQERFLSEVSDREFTLKNRELDLRRMEDQLNAQKKEMALAKFDEEGEGMGMSSAQLAKLADK